MGYQIIEQSREKVGMITWQGHKHTAYGDLYELEEFDISEYRHVPLKEGEKLYRYKTDIMFNYGPVLIKVNPKSGLIYFLQDTEERLDRAWFESKGTKAKVNIFN